MSRRTSPFSSDPNVDQHALIIVRRRILLSFDDRRGGEDVVREEYVVSKLGKLGEQIVLGEVKRWEILLFLVFLFSLSSRIVGSVFGVV
jgi:hypothetical protein